MANILCIGAGYVGGPTMAVIAKNCPQQCKECWPYYILLNVKSKASLCYISPSERGVLSIISKFARILLF